MKSASKPKPNSQPSGYLATCVATLTLILFAACAAEFGQAAVFETHGNTITIKPFDWLNNSSKKKSAQADAAGNTSAGSTHRRARSRFGVGNEGPYNYAMTHDGYLLAQFTAPNPTKEADLHMDGFWPGGIQGLETPYSPDAYRTFGQYALLLFLQSKEGDGRVACSDGAVDLLNYVKESQISERSMDFLARRYDPIPPAADAEDYTPTRTMTPSQYNLLQAAVARASNIGKMRFYFVGPENGAAQCDIQKGEFTLACKGPANYGLFLKRGEEFPTQFLDDRDHLLVIKMEVADAQNLIKSGDHYAFIYEVEGRLCNGEEKSMFCAAKRLQPQRNLMVAVETTRLYLLQVPLQTGGLKAARISLLNTNILPARIQMPRNGPDASAIANYPPNGGRSPEKQRQIDAAVQAAHQAAADQESAYGAAAAQGVGEGSDAAARVFDPNYNVKPYPY